MSGNARLTLHPKQMQVFKSPHRFKVVVAGRRWGKTALSKVTIIKRAASKPNQHVWYVAPTYRMAKQIMWQDLCDAIPSGWIRRVNETTMTIRLVNGSTIGLRGADKPDTLRGVGLHFLVLDEFQDMKPEVWTKVLRPTLASTGGHVLIIGTPKAFNHLYELYQLGQRGEEYVNDKGVTKRNPWASWQFPTITSPFIPDEEVEAARRDMDEKSFRQEFEACHLPDTEIELWNGKTKMIKDVVVGDCVVHVTDAGERIPAEVLKIGVTGHKKIMDVTLETGEVVSASAHHKFKVHKNDNRYEAGA